LWMTLCISLKTLGQRNEKCSIVSSKKSLKTDTPYRSASNKKARREAGFLYSDIEISTYSI
jgi:hypothetical protein